MPTLRKKQKNYFQFRKFVCKFAQKEGGNKEVQYKVSSLGSTFVPKLRRKAGSMQVRKEGSLGLHLELQKYVWKLRRNVGRNYANLKARNLKGLFASLLKKEERKEVSLEGRKYSWILRSLLVCLEGRKF